MSESDAWRFQGEICELRFPKRPPPESTRDDEDIAATATARNAGA